MNETERTRKGRKSQPQTSNKVDISVAATLSMSLKTTKNFNHSLDEQFSVSHSTFRAESVQKRDGTAGEGKRRSRKSLKLTEGGVETFRCGCGKTYMSYPALYTHAKVKHSGIYPEGTYTGVKKKQGRPKKLVDDKQIKLDFIQKKRNLFLTKFKEFFHSIQLISPVDSAWQNQKEAIDGLKAMSFFCPSLHQYTVEVHSWLQLETQAETEESIDRVINLLAESNKFCCLQVMALFIVYCSSYVTAKGTLEIYLLLSILRKTLNEKGYKVKHQLDQEKKEDQADLFNKNCDPEESEEGSSWIEKSPGEEQEPASPALQELEKKEEQFKHFDKLSRGVEVGFCEYENADVIPDISSVFFLEYLPKAQEDRIVESQSREGVLLGRDASKKVRVVQVIRLFCQWLYMYNFSEGYLEVNRTGARLRPEEGSGDDEDVLQKLS